MPVVILAGDIGGTKTSLALYAVHERRLLRSTHATLPSADYPDLAAALSAFLLSPRPPIHAAAFGVPGPVAGGRAKTTNLPWTVDAAELGRFLGVSAVTLLNDLQAMAAGVEGLDPEELLTLQAGSPDPTGNAAVIAAGTGLGQALLVRHEGRLHAHATEGGHADFAPIDEESDAFLAWLRAQHGRVSAERVVSGMGLAALYRFHHDPSRGGSDLHLAEGADVGAGVAEAARTGSCTGCRRAFALFLRCYGAEAGNLALKAGATSGLYIGGGIAAKNAAALEGGPFLRAFREKGRMGGYMERIPVHVILNPSTPVLGAALVAARSVGFPV